MPYMHPITAVLLAVYFGGLLTVLGHCVRRDLAPFRPGRHRARSARRTSARLAVVATIVAVAGGVTIRPATAADPADSVPSWTAPGMVEPPVRPVANLRLTYADRVEGTRWLWAEFNDGRVVVFRACGAEDGRRCWWDASRRGNGIGFSWLRYAGHTYRMPARSDVVDVPA